MKYGKNSRPAETSKILIMFKLNQKLFMLLASTLFASTHSTAFTPEPSSLHLAASRELPEMILAAVARGDSGIRIPPGRYYVRPEKGTHLRLENIKDFSIDANFAYIVKQSGKPDTLLIPAVETDGNRQLQCQIGGSSQMFAHLDIFKRDCLVDRPEGGFFKVWPAIGRRSPCRDFQRMEKLRGLMVHHFLGFRLALLVFAEVGELFGNGISALLAALLLVETTVRVSQCLVKRDGLAAVHNPVSVA